jgi:putative copper export protein
MILAAESVGVGPTSLDIAASLLFYLGLTMLIGAAGVAVLSPLHLRVRKLIALAWPIAMAGAFAIGYQRLSTFQLPLGEFLFAYTLGNAALLRVLGLAVAWIGVILVARGNKKGAWVVLAGCAVASFGHAMGGHANIASVPLLARTWHALHIFAIGVWVGGLATMLLATRGSATVAKAEAWKRFSRIAGPSIVVVAGTGVLRSMETIGFSIGALLETSYGRLVLFKSQLLIAIAAFGAHNRYREIPRAHRLLGGLRRFGMAEVGTASAVFVAAAFLAGTEPATEAYAAAPVAMQQLDPSVQLTSRTEPSGLVLYSAAWADGVQAQLYIDDDNALHVTMFDKDGAELTLQKLRALEQFTSAGWGEPERFSKGHFLITAPTDTANSVYVFQARATDGRFWQLVLNL